MPNAAKKIYAVRVGREGPQIYDSWAECNANVSRWPNAIHKSFRSRLEAEEWLALTGPTSSMEPMSSSGPSVPSTFRPGLAGSGQALQAGGQAPTPGGRDRTPIETSTPGPLPESIVLSEEQKKCASEG